MTPKKDVRAELEKFRSTTRASTGSPVAREKDVGYQGWRNYETWNVHLWLSNDQGLYEETNRLARRIKDGYRLGQAIKEMLEEAMPKLMGLWSDLLGNAFRSADFTEIGRSWLEGLEE